MTAASSEPPGRPPRRWHPFALTIVALGCAGPAAAPSGSEAPTAAAPLSDTMRDLRTYVDFRVRLGFDTAEEIAASAQELFAGEPGYPGDRRVEASVRQWIAAALEAQASWERPTDAERLDRAFERLEARGILARHCYGPTRTWAAADLRVEAAIARSRGVPVRGQVYYTAQDAETLVDGRLSLAWGVHSEPGLPFAAQMAVADSVAAEIVDALRAEGLDASWDGIGASVITLEGLTWRHPRDPATGEPLLSSEARYVGEPDDAAREPEDRPPFPTSVAGEWLVRVGFLANDGDYGAYANLWHIHAQTRPEQLGTVRIGDSFDPSAVHALDLMAPALGTLGGRHTRFDLVAPPSSPLLGATRQDFVTMVDALVLVPADEASLASFERSLAEWYGDQRPIVLIELDTDAWDEAAMARVEARYPGDVWRVDLREGTGVYDVLKEMIKRTLTSLQRIVEP